MLCPLPAGCRRADKSLVHVLHLENSVLKPQVEPPPFSWQASFIVRKRLLYQPCGYLIPHRLTLFDLQSLVSHQLLSVEMHLESVYMATACPKCPATVISASVSLTGV